MFFRGSLSFCITQIEQMANLLDISADSMQMEQIKFILKVCSVNNHSDLTYESCFGSGTKTKTPL
jgi:hypothetical protein